MTPEQIHDSSSLRSPLSPPEGPITFARSIFWNECELRAGWRFLIYLLFVVLFTLAGSFLAMALHLPQIDRRGITATSMLVHECVGVIAIFAAAAIMGMLEARPFGGYGLPHAAAFGARFWQGAAWGIAMITVIIFLIRAFGGFSFGGLALRGSVLWGYAVLWAVAFLFVGFFEEFLFRGYAQFTLTTGIGFWPTAIALSGGFGAVHLFNRGEDKIGALSVFVIGMFFCLTLRRTGTLWFAVGLHAAFDWGETFLFSVPDSGLVAPGHMLNSSLQGPAWLTGGTVGPEGSVMAFVVVALAAVLFAIVYPGADAQASVVAGDSATSEPHEISEN
jgi:membrane protease YdiL (CAAX protease family)